MNELALFAGAGGGILGGHLLGWRTVCAVERDAYAAQVLAQRQNDGCLPAFPIWSDVCTFDGNRWRGIVDVISGGFPCQDISVAGKGQGITGDSSGLWKEMARIIREVRPGYVYVENSPVLTSRGLGIVLGDLAELGFDAKWGVLGASDCGAPHIRKRVWILANARRNGKRWEAESRVAPNIDESSQRLEKRRDNVADTHSKECVEERGFRSCSELGSGSCSKDVSDSYGEHVQGLEQESQSSRNGRQGGLHDRAGGGRKLSEWPVEPRVGRVVNGVAYRVDRLKAIGNGQVSRVAATAFSQLMEINNDD